MATITRGRHLEGVVATRLDTPYQWGRRRRAWLKHKHRHRERLTVTGWRPGYGHDPDEVLVARREPDGTLRHAGGVRYGLGDLNDEAAASTTQMLLGPPGSQIGTGGFDHPDANDDMRLWNLAPLIPDREGYSRIFEAGAS